MKSRYRHLSPVERNGLDNLIEILRKWLQHKAEK